MSSLYHDQITFMTPSGWSSLNFAVGPDTREGCHYISVSKTYLDLLLVPFSGIRQKPEKVETFLYYLFLELVPEKTSRCRKLVAFRKSGLVIVSARTWKALGGKQQQCAGHTAGGQSLARHVLTTVSTH